MGFRGRARWKGGFFESKESQKFTKNVITGTVKFAIGGIKIANKLITNTQKAEAKRNKLIANAQKAEAKRNKLKHNYYLWATKYCQFYDLGNFNKLYPPDQLHI